MKKTLLTYTAQKTYTVLLALFVTLAMLALLISCDQDQVQDAVIEYTTPTIKGIITIPDGSDVAPEDIYVKVIDSNDNTVTIQKANADKAFVVQNLDAQMKYKILFTSQQPEFTNAKSLTALESSTETPTSKSTTETKGVGGWIENVVPAIKEGNNVGQVLLKPLGTIKGKALIDDATEHYDITIYIPGTSYMAKTAADGSFAIYNVPEGTYTLRYTLEDHVPLMLNDIRLVCPDNSDNPEKIVSDVTLISNVGELEGYVLLDGQTDNTGISIKLESADKATSYNSTTSSNGYFKISKVKPGSYKVIMSYTDYISQETNYFDVKEATITSLNEKITLIKNVGTIEGSVKLSGEITDFSGIGISITSLDGGNNYTAITDANGSFTKKVKPGKYNVTASYAGYGSQTLEVTVNDNSTSKANFSSLTLSSGSVAGFVVLEGATDYSGVTITLTDSADKTNLLAEISATDGSFRITGIKKSGTYLLTYSKNGYVTNLSNSVDVTVGSVATVSSVTLKSIMSTISGKIQLEGASSHENTTILLKNEDNQYTATTDQKGEYKINRVLPGTYTLIASKDGYVTTSTNEFVVESSSEKEVELLSLSVAIRSIVGKVTLELGSDYAGALVTATNLSDSTLVYSAISNSSGDYTLAGMKPGEYQIVISKNGYVTATLPTVNIAPNTLTNVDSVELAIAKGEITGIARLEGYTDYSGIKVSIVGTSFSTTTEKDGTYSLTVPTGNYSGGIRYEYEDFETASYVANIAVLQTTSYTDAYAVPDVILNCINVPKVYGNVTVKGVTKEQFEDITISIAELPEFTYKTKEDGAYIFEHVPVGTYTLEITRENAKKVTKIVEVKASPEIKLESIELIPDAVTLYGNISLKGIADYSGVTVKVTTPDSVELKTVTNAAGYWYISNIIASKSHTITFEKEGWENQSFTIAENAYEPMSETDYSSTYPVELQDTVAPVITNITATVGKSTEGNREVYIYLFTEEEGSGIKYIQGNTENSFDSVTEQEYYNLFKLLIPDVEGIATIYVRVKDAAGNISNVISTAVTLKNDRTELSNVLSGDKLHLTKANNPYVMTDNILIPEGETLVIDAGVEIQVKGEYYIQVEGTLQANGTADDRIKIYGIDAGENKWVSIKVFNDNGTKIAYTDISGLSQGIQGYGELNNSIVSAASGGYALGYYLNGWYDNEWISINEYFKGTIANSTLSGSIYAMPSSVKNSVIKSDSINLEVLGETFNSDFSGTLNGTMQGTFIQNTITGTGELTFTNSYLMNNQIQVANINVERSLVKYTTICNSAMSLSSGVWSKNILNNCTFSSYSVNKFTYSNLIGCGPLTITSDRSNLPSYDMTNNYWGDDKTVELNQKIADDTLSFLHHYTNDFNLSKVLWGNYSSTAFTDCGYQGKEFRTSGSYSGYSIGDTGPAGGIVFYDKGYYSDGWRYLEAASQDLRALYPFGYYRPDGKTNTNVGTSSSIGSGKVNTDGLTEVLGETAYTDYPTGSTKKGTYATKACVDYMLNGYDDWFLPSKVELSLMYINLNKQDLGDFSNDGWVYWSSSENNYDGAWGLFPDNGYLSYYTRFDDAHVRPIRAF